MDSLAYVGSLATLGGRAAYYTFIGPFQGKPLRLSRAISQAMDVGVRALPILSLITFFIGLILALQAAYELRRFGAMNYVATAVAVSMSRELGPLITAIVVIGRSGSAFAAEIDPVPGHAEISGHDCDAALPHHLGQRHGHPGRLTVRRSPGRFYVCALCSGFAGFAAPSRHHDRPREKRDVWYNHHRRGMPGGTGHRRGRGASRPLHHAGRRHVDFSRSFGRLGFHNAVLFCERKLGKSDLGHGH